MQQHLQPSNHLLALFEDCHNYIYANEGMLKEKIFHEISKLLLMKLADEQRPPDRPARFAITVEEHRSAVRSSDSGFMPRMESLFNSVKDAHPGLFAGDSGLDLHPITLAHVVGLLQSVSLSSLPGDVKGEAFQSFVYRHQRGDRGEYFTPHPLVRLAVEIVDPQPDEKVIDPACGSGGFLIHTIAHVDRPPSAPPSPHRGEGPGMGVHRRRYIEEQIRGIEFNPDVARAAALRLTFEGGSGAEVLCANALRELDDLEGRFDVVLTNPPFGSRGRVEDRAILDRYDLGRKWVRLPDREWRKTSASIAAQTPEILFLERCLALLRPGGRMGIVLPDGLLQNATSGYVRAWLRSRGEVLAVVSVPQEAFVPYGTGIKTSVLFLRRLPVAHSSDCFMARVKKVGYDVKGQPVYRRDEAGKVLKNASGAPLVDEDIGDIATAYREHAMGEFRERGDDIFLVSGDSLNSRLDVEHYLPNDRLLIGDLVARGAKPLGDLVEIVAERDGFRSNGEDRIRYIAISDVDARTLQVVAQQSMQAYEAPTRAAYRLRAGDLITAVSGASTGTTVHASALITEEEDGALCSNGLAVLRNVRGVEPLFLLAYFRTQPFLRQVRRLMTGHAIPAISLEDLASVLVPVPPEAQQLEIASYVRQLLALRGEALRVADRLVARVDESIHLGSRLPQGNF